jgi:hypothetical protein
MPAPTLRIGTRACKSEVSSSFFSKTRSPHMFEQTFKNIDDVLRKEAGCASELDYTEQSS